MLPHHNNAYNRQVTNVVEKHRNDVYREELCKYDLERRARKLLDTLLESRNAVETLCKALESLENIKKTSKG